VEIEMVTTFGLFSADARQRSFEETNRETAEASFFLFAESALDDHWTRTGYNSAGFVRKGRGANWKRFSLTGCRTMCSEDFAAGDHPT